MTLGRIRNPNNPIQSWAKHRADTLLELSTAAGEATRPEEETENRKKIRIKNIDMSQEMKEAAIKCAKDAIDKYDIE